MIISTTNLALATADVLPLQFWHRSARTECTFMSVNLTSARRLFIFANNASRLRPNKFFEAIRSWGFFIKSNYIRSHPLTRTPFYVVKISTTSACRCFSIAIIFSAQLAHTRWKPLIWLDFARLVPKRRRASEWVASATTNFLQQALSVYCIDLRIKFSLS